ncbi:hypothetical protein EC973_003111 [Apophysomyces ossiformis]|uniref:Zinc knuckle-domain-containing protein n=1 Tax=Apophysomyces ossiformis TaxID=679940 RepID=A0A8H7BJU0_9FUNG|nr:hypothetical protein EC973_003111 [Apophysomyces ossiformis]
MYKTGPKYPSSTPKASPSTRCQKCLEYGHWTYECKGARSYKSRPTRTQQLTKPLELMQPDLPDELQDRKGLADKILAAKKKKKTRRRSSSTSSSSDSTSSASSSSDSSATSSGESSSDSESDSDSASSKSSVSNSDSYSSGTGSDDSSSEGSAAVVQMRKVYTADLTVEELTETAIETVTMIVIQDQESVLLVDMPPHDRGLDHAPLPVQDLPHAPGKG